MPIKLIPPRKGKTPYWYGKGSYLGVAVDRSTKAVRKSVAAKVVAKWEREIEGDTFAIKGEPTFLSAAVSYANAGGDRRRGIARLTAHFGERPLREITQDAIDAAAHELYPNASPATRNREVYTPVSAILKHAGVRSELRRPKGARGRVLVGWLWPEDAERLFVAADKQDAEFGLLCRFLCYTGLRLTEGLRRFTIDSLRLSEGFAFIPKTKNGNPRPVHLPPHIVAALANHPRGLARPGETVFRFHKGGRLYDMLRAAAAEAKVTLPEREAFHLFRHTYGTWMRRYGGLDTRGLVGTGVWDSEQSAGRYAHTVASEDAQRADRLPVGGLSVETKAKAS
jgi:integrase